MEKQDFRKLFDSVLEEAVEMAENNQKLSLPRNYRIKLEKGTHSEKSLLNLEEAFSELFIDENSFYVIIDISVVGFSQKDNFSLVFIRPSPRKPVSFEKTWNYEAGLGPFKHLQSMNFKTLDEIPLSNGQSDPY